MCVPDFDNPLFRLSFRFLVDLRALKERENGITFENPAVQPAVY